MSRHYMEKVLKLWQCRGIGWKKESSDAEMSRDDKQLQKSNYVCLQMSRHHKNMAATSADKEKDYIVKMSHHQNNVTTSAEA